MRRNWLTVVVLLVWALPTASTAQEAPRRDKAFYEPALEYPVLDKIREKNRELKDKQDAETGAIRKRQADEAEAEKKSRQSLRAVLPEASYPSGPDQFESVFHFEPQAQYMTGTCWSFAATSFLESEIKRISGEAVKLSEMYPVYWEYVEKTRRFVRERGASAFGEGSQLNAVTRMMKSYGAVPLEAYPGVLSPDGWHDHGPMYEEMAGLLEHVKANDLWDEEFVIGAIRSILDRFLGPPPQTFAYKGAQYTPASFLAGVVQLDLGAYVQFMSTMKAPFWEQSEFEVADNWWHDESYYNVPLGTFFDLTLNALTNGYSVGIGGDVSEPGKAHAMDVAFIPSFDIPAEYIDQSAREYRINNGSTGDDHGVHLVGRAEIGGMNWFLIKDSGRSARHGRHDGYYFFREDFVKLKMLTVLVHRDAASEVLQRIEEEQKKRQELQNKASEEGGEK